MGNFLINLARRGLGLAPSEGSRFALPEPRRDFIPPESPLAEPPAEVSGRSEPPAFPVEHHELPTNSTNSTKLAGSADLVHPPPTAMAGPSPAPSIGTASQAPAASVSRTSPTVARTPTVLPQAVRVPVPYGPALSSGESVRAEPSSVSTVPSSVVTEATAPRALLAHPFATRQRGELRPTAPAAIPEPVATMAEPPVAPTETPAAAMTTAEPVVTSPALQRPALPVAAAPEVAARRATTAALVTAAAPTRSAPARSAPTLSPVPPPTAVPAAAVPAAAVPAAAVPAAAVPATAVPGAAVIATAAPPLPPRQMAADVASHVEVGAAWHTIGAGSATGSDPSARTVARPWTWPVAVADNPSTADGQSVPTRSAAGEQGPAAPPERPLQGVSAPVTSRVEPVPTSMQGLSIRNGPARGGMPWAATGPRPLQVRIGTVEVKVTPAPVPPQAPQRRQPPGPRGFDGYRRMRGHERWEL